jgi:hypothetical protein
MTLASLFYAKHPRRWRPPQPRRVGRRPRRQRPVFEALEPRLLLAAEPLTVALSPALDDIAIRLDAETERIQVVGNGTKTVVVDRAVTETSEIIVTGTPGDDAVTLDPNVPAGLPVRFEGGAGHDTLDVSGRLAPLSLLQYADGTALLVDATTVIDAIDVEDFVGASDVLNLSGVPGWTSEGPGGLLSGDGEAMPSDPGEVPADDGAPQGPSFTGAGQVVSISAVAVDPFNADTVYAGTGNLSSSRQGGRAIGLLKSTNGGRDWEFKGLGPGEFGGSRVLAIVPTRFRDSGGTLRSVLLVAVDRGSSGFQRGGVFRSLDGGDTWQPVGGLPSLRAREVLPPDVSTTVATPGTGGAMPVDDYDYQISFVDATGRGSPQSSPITVSLVAGQDQVAFTGIPTGPSGTTARRIYRTTLSTGVQALVGTLEGNTSTTFTDIRADATATSGAVGSLSVGTYQYLIIFVERVGERVGEHLLVDNLQVTLAAPQNRVELRNLPTGPTAATARRIYRTAADGGELTLVGNIDNTVPDFDDNLNDRQIHTVALPPGTVSDLKAVRDPADPARFVLFAAHVGDGPFGGGGIYRSTDGGGSWARISDDIPDLPATAGGTGGIFSFDIGQGLTPAVAGRPTPTRPNGTASAAGGTLRVGTHRYVVTFVTADGVEGPPSPVRAVTVGAGQNRVDLTAIATSPGLFRNIYRDNPGGSTTDFQLIHTIRDDTTAAFRDTGSAAPINRLKLAVQAVGADTRLYLAVVSNVTAANENLTRFLRSDDPTAATPTWQIVFDTPGTRDVQNGGFTFDGLNPGGQGNIHFSLAADPASLDVVYMGGDRAPVLHADSSTGNTDFSGRLFRVDTGTSFVAAMTGNPLTDPARGEPVTAQLALLPGPPAGMSGAPGAAGAGAVTDGAYRYVVTFVDSVGVESNPSPGLAVSVAGSGAGTTVSLTAIPTGPARTAARLIYRTEAGGTVPRLVARIGDNATTTHTDNTANAALGPAMNVGGAPEVAAVVAASRNAGAAGSMAPGAYQYAVSFLDENGVESQTSALIPAVVNPGDDSVRLTNLPIGPAGTASRVLYRTAVGGSSFRAVTFINNNTATTHDDGDPARFVQFPESLAPPPDVIAAGTAATGVAGAGALTDGRYSYVFTFLDATGRESRPSAGVAVTLAGQNRV